MSVFAIALVALAALIQMKAEAILAHEERLIVGLHASRVDVSSEWPHAPYPNSNLDLLKYSPPQAGQAVSWQSVRKSGNDIILATTVPYGGDCTGVQIRTQRTSNGANLGDYWFVHIYGSVNVGTTWKTSQTVGTYTIKQVGTVLGQELPSCPQPGSWDAPHLHQGGNTAGTKLYQNPSMPWAADSDADGFREIFPTGDSTNRYMHRYVY
jgi:hypothetical protein